LQPPAVEMMQTVCTCASQPL